MRAAFRALLLAAALAAPLAGSVGAAVPSAPQTSCLAIAHIGDSISAGMESPTHLPDEDLRLRARYEGIGATDVRFDISGARSVVEHLAGQRNGAEAARRLRDEGFAGCWVVALGTNDAANVAVGSGYGYSERIDRMMEIIGDDPVVWVDVATRTEQGPYAREQHAAVQHSPRQGPRPVPGDARVRLVRCRRRRVVPPGWHPLHE